MTWLRGARCTGPKATARRCRAAGAEGDGSAAPRPKIAAVERREASVPRHGTQGASQAPDVPRYGTSHGCLARTRTSLGAPLPLDSGERSKGANPRAQKTRRENEEVLFDARSFSARSFSW